MEELFGKVMTGFTPQESLNEIIQSAVIKFNELWQMIMSHQSMILAVLGGILIGVIYSKYRQNKQK